VIKQLNYKHDSKCSWTATMQDVAVNRKISGLLYIHDIMCALQTALTKIHNKWVICGRDRFQEF